MGFLSNFLTGSDSARAAKAAAAVQAAAAEKAIGVENQSLESQQALYQPYSDLGSSNISKLNTLVNDPQAQLDYVQNNPFFKALQDKATSTLLNNRAAGGKVASGGTADALQNSLMILGNDLLQTQIGNNQNLVNIGQNAASSQASALAGNSANVSNLLTGQGAATAAGIVGAANARTAAQNNLVNTAVAVGTLGMAGKTGGSAGSAPWGTTLSNQGYNLCDIRAKENIKAIGKTDKGLTLYRFNYIGSMKPEINVMAQDVEKVIPQAVIEINGLKHVNMEMVYGS